MNENQRDIEHYERAGNKHVMMFSPFRLAQRMNAKVRTIVFGIILVAVIVILHGVN